jgi:hypothetical protein
VKQQLGWAIPTSALRVIAGQWHAEMQAAAREGVPLPGDEWIDSKLRDCGCHEAHLQIWRSKIRRMTFAEVYESSQLVKG